MEERHRIGSTRATLMYAVACVFEIISLIPVVGIGASIISFITFWMWFKWSGASYIAKPTRIVRAAALALFGSIPFLGSLPFEHIATVFLNIRDVRKEDAVYNSKNIKKAQQDNENQKRIERAFIIRRMRGIGR